MTTRITQLIIFSFFLFVQSSNAQCWNLVWEDNFDGTTLDQTKWSFQTGDGGWGNNELQYYTDRIDNVNVNAGILEIIGKSENYMGADYTSGRIRSIDKGDWTYGRFEASIKMPIGQGIWPAFWMLPTDNIYGGWPASGEMDIMEYLGHQANITYATAHYGTNGDHQFQGDSYTLPTGDFSQSFHEFAMEWKPDTLEWFVDDLLIFTLTATDIAPYTWVFDQDFHFILNLAIGGNWPGNPDGTTVFPQTLEVDYVRAYQLIEDIKMIGDDYIQPCEIAVEYAVPDMSGTTYNWSIPSGASITSGESTHSIIINFNGNEGAVSCEFTNSCGTETLTTLVEIDPNFWGNPDFEDDYINWSNRSVNGGSANFSITSTNPQQGAKSAFVEVTATGINPWDIQLTRNNFSIVQDEEYIVEFWAKADINGRTVPVNIINAIDFTVYGSIVANLTDDWTFYSFIFTAPTDAGVLLTIDLGDEIGEFYFDSFSFSKNSPLPIEFAFFEASAVDDKHVRLEWATYTETDNAFFEIQHSIDGHTFSEVEKINGQLDSKTFLSYEMLHQIKQVGEHYYRIKQVNLDGSYSFSDIRVVSIKERSTFYIYPNPSNKILSISGVEGTESILIYDMRGQLKMDVSLSSINTKDIDISKLSVGIYLMKILSKHSTQVISFIKQ